MDVLAALDELIALTEALRQEAYALGDALGDSGRQDDLEAPEPVQLMTALENRAVLLDRLLRQEIPSPDEADGLKIRQKLTQLGMLDQDLQKMLQQLSSRLSGQLQALRQHRHAQQTYQED